VPPVRFFQVRIQRQHILLEGGASDRWIAERTGDGVSVTLPALPAGATGFDTEVALPGGLFGGRGVCPLTSRLFATLPVLFVAPSKQPLETIDLLGRETGFVQVSAVLDKAGVFRSDHPTDPGEELRVRDRRVHTVLGVGLGSGDRLKVGVV
jgi:hypothetical protein